MISEIDYTDCEKWNSIVKSFSDFEVFYLNEYVTAFMKEHEKNGTPILLLYEYEADRAINVVFKRDISKDVKMRSLIEVGKYYDLITPYGYGGFHGKISDYERMNQEYNKYCINNHYICEFVRFDLFTDYFRNYDGEVETRMHNVVRNLEDDIDTIWMDFKQKVRKNVKRANTNNLKIIYENSDEHLKDFLKIYYSTMDRNAAESEYYFSETFFRNILKMQNNIMLFYVLYEEMIISAELVVFGSKNCYSYLGGTNRDFFDLRPNDFLKHEVIKWAKKIGLKNFVLGGGYGSDDGIFQYKAYLAPKGIVPFYIGRKVFDLKIYEKLVGLRSQENPDCKTTKFFPQYRA